MVAVADDTAGWGAYLATTLDGNGGTAGCAVRIVRNNASVIRLDASSDQCLAELKQGESQLLLSAAAGGASAMARNGNGFVQMDTVNGEPRILMERSGEIAAMGFDQFEEASLS